MKSTVLTLVFAISYCAASPAFAQEGSYDGLSNSLSNIYRVSNAKTFSITPENFTGEQGKGGMATTGVGSHAASETRARLEGQSFRQH